MPAKGDGRLTSSEFADAMRGGDTKKGKKAASRLNTVGLRSDLVLEGKESLGAFGGKSRSLLNIDGKGKLLHPAHLGPAHRDDGHGTGKRHPRKSSADAETHTAHFKGARTGKELRSFAKEKRLQQSEILMQDEGMLLDSEWGGAKVERTSLAATEAKIRRILYRDYHFVERTLLKWDEYGEGKISRRNIFKAMEEMRLGLSGKEVQQVLHTMARAGHTCGREIRIEGFLAYFGGDDAARASDKHKASLARSGKLQNFLMKPPDITTDLKAEYQKAIGTDLSKPEPMLVFWFGFLVCPVWCLGWIWVNSKDPASRRRGRRSVTLSVLFLLAGLVVAAVLMIISPEAQMNASHCEKSSGLLVAIKMRGPSANLQEMGNYDSQYNFKLATHGLWFTNAKDKSLMAEEAVLIDDISPLTFDADGATLGIILRLVTRDAAETTFYREEVRTWIMDQQWMKTLRIFNLFFESIWLDTIVPPLASHTTIVTPAPYDLSPYAIAELSVEDPAQEFLASPYLGIQPPTRSSSIQSQNPSGWKHHNYTVLQTCWWTARILVPSDACLEPGGPSCEENGAAALEGGGQRFLLVQVLSESTYDVLDVYIRQDRSSAKYSPAPDWYAGTELGRGVPVRDFERCIEPSNPSTCKITYTIRLGKGPHKFVYLMGVHGKSRPSATVPFKVKIEYGNFNTYAKAYNPYSADYSKASRPMVATASSLLTAALLAYVFFLLV